MKEFLNSLAKTALFQGISESEIESMLNCLQARKAEFKKGEYIFRHGESSPVNKIDENFCLCKAYQINGCRCSVARSWLTLGNPMNFSPPGSSVMGFPSQEYWSGLPFPFQGIFPTKGSNPSLLLGR